MRNSMSIGGVLVWLVLMASPIAAQDQEEAAQATPAQTESTTNQEEALHRQMMEQSKQMEEMAKAMTSMAQMCETMMKMEMQSHPLKVVAVSVVGGLLTVALLLFVVLEIEWIRHGHRLNKKQT